MQNENYREVLEQLGYFRKDTRFMSLNLTDMQMDLFTSCLLSGALPNKTAGIEDALERIMRDWLDSRADPVDITSAADAASVLREQTA